MEIKTLVLGAGVGGLGAGCWLKRHEEDFYIVDRAESLPQNMKNGVHYLHSIPNVPFEFEFKEISLLDGVLGSDGEIRTEWTINDALKYSRKVRGVQCPTSIMAVGKEQKAYIPTVGTMDDYVKRMEQYITPGHFMYGYTLTHLDIFAKKASFEKNDKSVKVDVTYQHLISTVPLKYMQEYFGTNFRLDNSPVHIWNYDLLDISRDWILNVYIPSEITPVYRFSVIEKTLSVESSDSRVSEPLKSFPSQLFTLKSVIPTSTFEWKDGKIVSISRSEREKLVSDLMQKDVYQIGRFGLWNRKLLIDSTIEQARVVVHYILSGKSPLHSGVLMDKLS